LTAIFDQVTFIAAQLFKIGGCYPGNLFELAGKMGNAAIMQFKGYIG
jgi:hypothetical protein